MKKALITHSDFGSGNKEAVNKIFDGSSCEVVFNKTGRAMSETEIIDCVNREGVEAILVYSSADQLTQKVFENCPSLKVVSRHGVGVDNIDIATAKKYGVEVRTTAGGNDFQAVADLTFGLLLAAARQIAFSDRCIRQKIWRRDKAIDIWGKTLGIIGFGRIGKAVAQRAKGFDMKILVSDPFVEGQSTENSDIFFVDRNDLFKKSDFITLHCNATLKNQQMINEEAIAQMKDGAILVNTARASLVCSDALLEGLKTGKLAAAAVDVYDEEPAMEDKLIKAGLENMVFTPHLGPYTKEVLEEMDILAAKNLVAPKKCFA